MTKGTKKQSPKQPTAVTKDGVETVRPTPTDSKCTPIPSSTTTTASTRAKDLYNRSSEATKALLALLDETAITASPPQPPSNTKTTPNEPNQTTTPNRKPIEVSNQLSKATTLILRIKEVQRSLGLLVNSGLTESKANARRVIEAQALALQNIRYERNHLRNEIRACRQLECRYLVRMAREEMGIDVTEDDTEDHDGGNTEGDGTTPTHDTSALPVPIDEREEGEEGEEHTHPTPTTPIPTITPVAPPVSVLTQNDSTALLARRRTDDAIVDSFLTPSSSSTPPPQSSTNTTVTPYTHRDPSLHSQNLHKLHAELTSRKTLQEDLHRATLERTVLSKRLVGTQNFLQAIPEKLVGLEKSTTPLQEYFLGHRGGGTLTDYGMERGENAMEVEDVVGNDGKRRLMSELRFTGSERKKRLKRASDLSGPLYTLFVQLQSYLDANSDGTGGNGGGSATPPPPPINLTVVDVSNPTVNEAFVTSSSSNALRKWTEREEKALQLRIPIPDTASLLLSSSTSKQSSTTTTPGKNTAGGGSTGSGKPSSTRTVKLRFQYLPHLQVVTVHVAGGGGGGELGNNLSRLTTEEKAVADAMLWTTVKGGRGKAGRVRVLLLHNLFEGDDGSELPHGSAVDLAFVGGECGDEEGHVTEDEDYVVYDDDGVQHPTEIIATTDATVVTEHDVEMSNNDKETSSPLPSSPTSTAMDQAALQKIRQTLRNEKNGVKPYNWCQHLAGLHYPSPTTNNLKPRIEPSTKAVMQQLYRRVRAHATLSTLLSHLERKKPNPVPVHPCMPPDEPTRGKNVTARLSEWTEDTERSPLDDGKKYYTATIRRKTATLRATVEVDVRYPAVPPLWKLQPLFSGSSVGDGEDAVSWANRHGEGEVSLPPLYDVALGKIEAWVNVVRGWDEGDDDDEEEEEYGVDGDDCEGSEDGVSDSACARGGAALFRDDVEETYDWIIVHQLREIVFEWDILQRTMEEEGQGWKIGGRKRRGRDRLPIGFGMYRSGL